MSVEDEWERVPDAQEDLDVLFIKYQRGNVTIAQLIETAQQHGFEAEIKEEN